MYDVDVSILFRNAVIVFLILAVAAAVFVCAYTGIILMVQETHNMLPNNNNPLVNVQHAIEMISVPINAITLALVIAFLLAILVSIGIFYRFNLFSPFKYILCAWRKYAETLYRAKEKTNYWLSLFERSPEFIRPA
jgi:hypothetical protein